MRAVPSFAKVALRILAVCAPAWHAHAVTFSEVPLDVDGGKALIIAGEIVAGDADKLSEELIDRRKKLYIEVSLDSPGGLISEAREMAKAIRASGIDVAVYTGNTCASACFILFAGGARRIVEPHAFVGVHSASIGGKETVPTLAVTTALAREVATYGVPSSIIGKIVTTDPANLTWLSKEELGAMKVEWRQPTAWMKQQRVSSSRQLHPTEVTTKDDGEGIPKPAKSSPSSEDANQKAAYCVSLDQILYRKYESLYRKGEANLSTVSDEEIRKILGDSQRTMLGSLVRLQNDIDKLNAWVKGRSPSIAQEIMDSGGKRAELDWAEAEGRDRGKLCIKRCVSISERTARASCIEACMKEDDVERRIYSCRDLSVLDN